MSHDPHAGEHLQELLVGQILWTTWAGLLPLALVTAGVLAGWFGMNLTASPLGFYLLFALTITASVQVVGVYLVFASLIVPALVSGVPGFRSRGTRGGRHALPHAGSIDRNWGRVKRMVGRTRRFWERGFVMRTSRGASGPVGRRKKPRIWVSGAGWN